MSDRNADRSRTASELAIAVRFDEFVGVLSPMCSFFVLLSRIGFGSLGFLSDDTDCSVLVLDLQFVWILCYFDLWIGFLIASSLVSLTNA